MPKPHCTGPALAILMGQTIIVVVLEFCIHHHLTNKISVEA